MVSTTEILTSISSLPRVVGRENDLAEVAHVSDAVPSKSELQSVFPLPLLWQYKHQAVLLVQSGMLTDILGQEVMIKEGCQVCQFVEICDMRTGDRT
jgi:hypothetical protein